ncbi:molybdenum cofactor biosynthesis protein MoaE [Basilea psittacipulmonis]|uniref:Molybdopterin synthase catalytic subunit n=1 Tax=Basilea psittacipulmonis DSM 24701 TaxID=1072685 RepID=A0A077DFB4_9BURK|nr:molybdenum cofactor biosynthesis protein MoaE [Basilea psittacipulmonis]AIL32816.1 molybdopterin-converting factor chain 2 [Basilea psittacipulmonis DSM 24701]
MFFDITDQKIDHIALRNQLTENEKCGAYASFEGWVRRHNDGKKVDYLVYSVYEELAKKQGLRVIEQAKTLFQIEDAICVHRYGRLEIGDMAVYVGVSAGHRDAAFAACRYIIDEVKATVPIWKQEFYLEQATHAWLANPQAQR